MKRCFSHFGLSLVLVFCALFGLGGCIESITSTSRRSFEGGGNGAGYGMVKEFHVAENSHLLFPAAERVEVESIVITQTPAHGTVAVEGQNLRYTPNAGFVGLDEAHYAFSSGSVSRKVKVLFDVGPCQRTPKDFPQGDNVHVISHIAGKTELGFYTSHVRVKPTEKPIVLYLVTRDPMVWHLSLAPGAHIERVVEFTWRHQERVGVVKRSEVVGVPDGVPVEHLNTSFAAIGWELELNDGRARRSQDALMEVIRSHGGKLETSYQGCFVGTRYEVPYSLEGLPTTCADVGEKKFSTSAVLAAMKKEGPLGSASHYNFLSQNCEGKCGPGDSLLGLTTMRAADDSKPIEVSEDGLTFGLENVRGPNGGRQAEASLGRSCGKYYVEFTVLEVRFSQTFFARSVGIFPTPLGQLEPRGGKQLGDTRLDAGEVLGMALDLDEGNLYLHRNGRWFVAPGERPMKSKVLHVEFGLRTYEPVRPGAVVKEGTYLRANFGGDLVNTPFQYPVPEGYLPGF